MLCQDIIHVLPITQLAVSDIQEVRVANDLSQERPGLSMDLIVGGVAVVGLAVDWDRSVGGDGDPKEELLQIGAVILVVAKRDTRRPVELVGGGLVGIVATEGDGGGILVQLVEANVELADSSNDQGSQEAGAVGTVEVIEGPAETIVVERGQLIGLQSEVFGYAAGSPGGEGVEGLAGQEEIGQQYAQDRSGGKRRLAAGQGREVLLEEFRKLQSTEEVANQWNGADFQGFQGSILPGSVHM